jgi:hypothetical protein
MALFHLLLPLLNLVAEAADPIGQHSHLRAFTGVIVRTSLAPPTPTGIGNNLTDKEYLQAGYDFGPAINYISQLGFYGAPRTFSISATFTY